MNILESDNIVRKGKMQNYITLYFTHLSSAIFVSSMQNNEIISIKFHSDIKRIFNNFLNMVRYVITRR